MLNNGEIYARAAVMISDCKFLLCFGALSEFEKRETSPFAARSIKAFNSRVATYDIFASL